MEAERYLKCPCGRVYHIEADKPKGFHSIILLIKHIGDYVGFKVAPSLQSLDEDSEL